MTRQQASRRIAAEPARIREILLDVAALPDWNPAFRSIDAAGGPPVPGRRYPITVRGGLSGTWCYPAIADQSIDTSWEVPGFHEDGSWLLVPDAAGTVVTHAFEHRGPLAQVLAPAYRGVADLRLDRLEERAVRRS